MEKPSVKEVILVEGKFDKERVRSSVDALVIDTEGFRIFKSKEKREMIRRLAFEKGLIILTDSDSAGLMIRNYVKSFVDSSRIINAYIPQIKGCEKRKTHPSKEGYLGVEGISSEIIVSALSFAGVKFNENDTKKADKISYNDLYQLGLAGRKDSSEKRKAFLKANNLPQNLSTKAIIDLINRGGIPFGDSGIR